MEHYSCVITGLSYPMRLDLYVAEKLKLLSRSQIKARNMKAVLNGKDVKLSRPVKTGDKLELSYLDEAPRFLVPQNIPLTIIYEDENCLVINKAQGMVVHPGAGNRQDTLANAIYYRMLQKRHEPKIPDGLLLTAHCPLLTNPYSLRPGIVHRLDKDTSGVMIAAYNDEALAMLSAQFKERSVVKQYLALVRGIPQNDKGIIHTRITRDPKNRKRFTALFLITEKPLNTTKTKGKIALTYYRILKKFNGYSLVSLRPKTGRTHQLRVHLAHIGHPIIGDSLYGHPCKDRFANATLMLHAYRLRITLPGHTEPSTFKAPLPERFNIMRNEE